MEWDGTIVESVATYIGGYMLLAREINISLSNLLCVTCNWLVIDLCIATSYLSLPVLDTVR